MRNINDVIPIRVVSLFSSEFFFGKHERLCSPNKSSLSSFLEPSTGDGNGRVSVLQVLIGGGEGEINKELCYCEMWYEEQAVKKENNEEPLKMWGQDMI